ncbi:DUF4385 family protein [Paenibacillus sp. 1P07SE]
MKAFDYELDYDKLDLRAHPELYTIGRGEQGVLMVEPYKSEILSPSAFVVASILHQRCASWNITRFGELPNPHGRVFAGTDFRDRSFIGIIYN